MTRTAAPALIAIEILSESDRMSAVMEKLHEYDAHGIPNIWVIDPRLRQIFAFHTGALREINADSLLTAKEEIALTRAEIFRP